MFMFGELSTISKQNMTLGNVAVLDTNSQDQNVNVRHCAFLFGVDRQSFEIILSNRVRHHLVIISDILHEYNCIIIYMRLYTCRYQEYTKLCCLLCLLCCLFWVFLLTESLLSGYTRYPTSFDLSVNFPSDNVCSDHQEEIMSILGDILRFWVFSKSVYDFIDCLPLSANDSETKHLAPSIS